MTADDVAQLLLFHAEVAAVWGVIPYEGQDSRIGEFTGFTEVKRRGWRLTVYMFYEGGYSAVPEYSAYLMPPCWCWLTPCVPDTQIVSIKTGDTAALWQQLSAWTSRFPPIDGHTCLESVES